MDDFYQLECDACGWQGHESQLVCTEDDPDNFMYCPECGSDLVYDIEYDED